MTNLEKAEGYLQLLKEEGKLDDRAFHELKQMYWLSNEEAAGLIEKFKATDQYKKINSRNITSRLWLLVFTLTTGFFVLYIGSAEDGIGIFSVYAVIYFLGAFGLVIYILKMLAERFNLTVKLPAIKSQAFIFLIFTICIVIHSEYQVYTEGHMPTNSALQELTGLILSENCIEKSTAGKNPMHYYSFHFVSYYNEFVWYSDDHLYAFKNQGLSPTDLKKATVLFFIWNREAAKGINYQNIFGHYPDIKISDIKKEGQRFIDPVLHEKKLKASAEKFRNIMLLVLLAAIVVFILENKKMIKIFRDKYGHTPIP